jgi:tetratricopeptide (TPR) repeat protein/NAD-dependent dihydropyrimidine dehydrogenase PreA subunit
MWVLIAVQALLLLHILVWWIGIPYGWKTISPIEPSESIETVSEGVINAGAIFFAIVLLSTAILGRWFCGWGCHVLLLQDWCLRLLRRGGIRPRAFRSRLLYVAPLALGLYMFVWPVVYRLAVVPFTRPDVHWPGFRVEVLTSNLWATMPGIGVGVVFLFLCGFVTVYVLGAKGFCTYACPYGGFFAPLDRLSLRRIHVDDSCAGCAHCTAACTSNVRVHEQVAAYGKVIDSGCMKTTDCIEACPNDALSMQWGPPALGVPLRADATRPTRKWDIGLAGDLVLGAVMLFSFLAWRGAYGLIPMLLSLGAAAIVTWAVWKAWRVLRDSNASLHRSGLKRSGRLTRSGFGFLCVAGLAALLTLQAAASKYIAFQAQGWSSGLEQQITAPRRPGEQLLSPVDEAKARQAIKWYQRANAIGDGGFSLASDPNNLRSMARLHAAIGEVATAAALLEEVSGRARPNQSLAVEQFMLEVSMRSPQATFNWVSSRLDEYAGWSTLRAAAVQWSLSLGDLAAASELSLPPDSLKYTALAALQHGQLDAAIPQLRAYLEAAPGDGLAWVTLAQVMLAEGDTEQADLAAIRAAEARSGMRTEAQADLDRELAAFETRRGPTQPSP